MNAGGQLAQEKLFGGTDPNPVESEFFSGEGIATGVDV